MRRSHDAPPFLLNALTALKPPERTTVSEWAEKYRILDSKSSAIPGRWSNSVTPYLVEIMDEFNNPETEEIIFVKPTQVGGTEVSLNMVGYTVSQDPFPMMLVYPTDRLGDYLSDVRVKPMLMLSPATMNKFYEKDSSRRDLKCDGMVISVEGANSPSGLASKPICRLMLDEVDKYPPSTKKEADPIKLAKERTKTFSNRKIYIASTPTIQSGHIWQAMELADVVKHYLVPCPHCGEMIEFKFKNLKWPENKPGMSLVDRAEFAVYVCQECGAVITDTHKHQMLNQGRWKIVERRTQYARSVAYWMNTLYSPFVRFAEIAKEFMLSKESPETLQNFTNSWLAEPWEDVTHRTNADLVLSRRTNVPELTVPDWAMLLTGGVDVQKGCVYYVIRAWGEYLTSQNIAYGRLRTLDDVTEVMNLEYRKESGESMIVNLCCIDSGDQTIDVYDYCFDNQDWAIAIKGASHPMIQRFKMSTINRTDSKAYGNRLVTVDGNSYKDTISARMHKEIGQGCWMVHSDTEREYAEMIASEQKVNEKRAGKIVSIWRPRTSHADNHYLDCEVYAFCAADLCHVRELHLQDKEPTKKESTKEDQSNWIQTETEGWL